MARLNLEKIVSLFKTNEDFSLTEAQYKKNTGRSLPKDSYYLKNNSALARTAKKHGYSIEVKERTICLKKAQ